MNFQQYSDVLHAHVHGFFAGHNPSQVSVDIGPIQRVVPGFHAIELAPGPRNGVWTYVSVGAGFIAAPGRRHLEFAITAEGRSSRHAELLAMTTHYHLTRETLDWGHTFPLGEAWVPGSNLDHMLVSTPYPFGPDFENVTSGAVHLHIYWLLPITEAERDFKRTAGIEELESRFESVKLEYWNPNRRSVV